MHDEFQIGTIAVILFGIMLSRCNTSSLRKDMESLRKEMRQDIDALRAEVHRSTTLLTELLFQHAEIITKLENK